MTNELIGKIEIFIDMWNSLVDACSNNADEQVIEELEIATEIALDSAMAQSIRDWSDTDVAEQTETANEVLELVDHYNIAKTLND